MRRFENHRLAQDYAGKGGQALHVYPAATPPCFRGTQLEAGRLFDQNFNRLTRSANGLGVRSVSVHHFGTSAQHADLTGKSLERAKALCARLKAEWKKKRE